MSLRSYYLNEAGTVQIDLSPEELSNAAAGGKGLLWVDICDTTEADGKMFGDLFKFHRLSIEDCVEVQIHPPKIDDYGSYLFLIVHGVNHASGKPEVIETAELALYVGANYVVSNHNFPLYSVESVVQQVESSGRPLQRGSDFLAYLLIDALVDNILPTVDLLSDIADDVEQEALTASNPATLQSIQRLRRSIRSIHRTMVPQRELLNRISRGDFTLIRQQTLVYYRDIYDHLVRIDDLNMNIRESADNAVSTYLSAVANRQNETMKVLAVVGAIFLPLTLLAGVYGMNFEYMPELGWRYSYFVVIGFMLFVITGALLLFWKRGWFGPRRLPDHILRPFTVEREKLRGHSSRTTRHPVSQGKVPPQPEAATGTSQGLDGAHGQP